jgi:hypothetical protein
MIQEMLRGILLLATVSFAASTQGAPHPGFFVATDGSDANPGSQEKPFATPGRARDAIRQLKADAGLPPGGVTVWIRGGTYYLPAPLELTEADSGSEDAPIVYRAFANEKPWLNGGRPIDASRFTPVTDRAVLARVDERTRPHLVQCDLKAAGLGSNVPELPDDYPDGCGTEFPLFLEVFCNGRRMQWARWPNEGFAHFTDIVDVGAGKAGIRDPNGPKRPGKFLYEGDRPSRWDVQRGVWLMGYWARAYLCSAVKVGKIDPEKHQIDLAVASVYGLDTVGGKRFYAFNLLEELDSPGEWFFDRTGGILYFWPPEPLAKCRVVVSELSGPIVELRRVSHVEIRGLGLENGRGDALAISDGRHDRVVGCTIRNVGRRGVDVKGGSDHRVVGCDIHDTGSGGVYLVGGDRKTLTPANHVASNNHIHHTSCIRRTHGGTISLQGVGIRAANNLIHHEPHTAVRYQGNDLLMEYNEIYWTGMETSEAGVFYTGYDWTVRGNVIRYNYIHHINDGVEGSPTGTKVVHLDDCASGTTFFGNVCYRVGYGVSICGGPDNIVENNIFVDCLQGVRLSDRGLQWWTWRRLDNGQVVATDKRTGREGSNLLTSLKRVPYNEPPYTKYPHLADILDREPVGAPWYCRVERNIFQGGNLLTVDRGVKPEWITIADNWDQGDPGFVAPERGDFRLKKDSPVFKLGFQPIPWEKIGPIHDGTRASWPVVAEPPPAGWKPRWLVLRDQNRGRP